MSLQQEVSLKLKQASAVLGVDPKDLQNLVQFRVLRPRRQDSIFWFNTQLLLEAKVALYLKESLGTSTELLARFTAALSKNLQGSEPTTLKYIWLCSRPARGQEPVEVRIPLANLARELQEQLPRADVYQDRPRGRKRSGWRREFSRKLESAARDLSGITESEITKAIRAYRFEKKRLPEITVGGSKRSA